MDQSQYVPRNRVAEHVERMNARKAETKSKARYSTIPLGMLERETLRDNIVTIMEVLSMTATEFSKDEHSGVSASVLSRLLNCHQETVERSTLAGLAKLVRVPPLSLVEGPLDFAEVRTHSMLHEILKADPDDEIIRMIEKRHRSVKPKT